MHDHESFRARRYFAELDGIRAVSVLLVFSTHIDAWFWERLHGTTGVTFFFVLSGLLITTLALREESADGRLDLGGFYLRRVFRIYPLYVLVLVGYCVLVLVLGFAPDRRVAFTDALPYYWGFFPEQVLLDPRVVEPPFSGAWSLGIEEKFYLVWPLLGFVLLRSRLRPRVTVLVVSVGLFAAAGALGQLGNVLVPYSLIAMGCLAAVLLHDPRGYARLQRLGETRVLAPLLVLVAVVQLTVPAIEQGQALYVAYGVPVTLLLVGLVVTTSNAAGWLAAAPLVFLGRISYGFYLTHNFALNAVQGALPDGDRWQGGIAPAVALVVAVLGAWALHVVVEKPLIRVGHRLAGRRKEARAVVAVAARRSGTGRHRTR